MILTSILSHGRVALGPEALAAGYAEGALVRVLVLSSGSVLLSLDDEPALLEVPYVPRLRAATLARLAGRKAGGG